MFQMVTHLNRPTYPVEYRDPYFRTRFSEARGEILSKPWKRDQSCLSRLHPLFYAQRLPYPVFADKCGISRRVYFTGRFSGGPLGRLVGRGEEGSLDCP